MPKELNDINHILIVKIGIREGNVATYVIELPAYRCDYLRALDEMAGKGSKLLPKIHWGCKVGVHNGLGYRRCGWRIRGSTIDRLSVYAEQRHA